VNATGGAVPTSLILILPALGGFGLIAVHIGPEDPARLDPMMLSAAVFPFSTAAVAVRAGLRFWTRQRGRSILTVPGAPDYGRQRQPRREGRPHVHLCRRAATPSRSNLAA